MKLRRASAIADAVAVDEPALTPAPVGGQQPFRFAAAPTAPGFEVADLLPPAAGERLRALRLRAKESHAIVPPYEDIRQASMARIEAENALKRLTNHPHDHGFRLKLDDRRVIAAQRTLDKATDELQRLQARRAPAPAGCLQACFIPPAALPCGDLRTAVVTSAHGRSAT